MPQFRIAVGYRTAHRRSEPEILASGYSPEAVQAAVDNADPAFERIEMGAFHFIRKGRRRTINQNASKKESPQAAEPGAPEESKASSIPEQPGMDELEAGPSLAPPSRRRR